MRSVSRIQVIKKVIDLCDYYILIIGKRYGSINESTGISYTEMEYNYAIDKGIPVLVFAIDNSVELEDDKTEKDDIKRGKLAEFKNRAMSNRLASIWRDETDLMGKVAISIMRAKSEIKRPGWHRGVDEEKDYLEQEVKRLREENIQLQRGALENKTSELNLDTNFYQKEIVLHYTERIMIFTTNTRIDKKTITVTLSELYKFVSLRLTGSKTIKEFIDAVSSFQSGYYVSEQDALIVRNKFEQLQLVESYSGKDDNEMLRLTELGKRIMNELNA